MWVFGNGESRKQIDLDQLKGYKVGCNAIMRDHAVDYLVCVDRRMVNEAVEKNINETTLVYTRPDWYGNYRHLKNIREVPDIPYEPSIRADEPFQWGSGPYAVLLAAKLSKERSISLVGFDLYSDNKLVNNMYKGTQGYDDSDKSAVDPRYWIHQISKVFECFPKVNFTVYRPLAWETPKAWIKSNVEVDKISNIYYNT